MRHQKAARIWALAALGIAGSVGVASAQVPSDDRGCKAKLKLVARGVNMPDPTLPFALPVLVQLHAGDGACWEAGFDVTQTKRNDATTFSGRMQVP